MAYPNHSGTKCPKCEKTSFELVEDFPTKSAFKMYYMRCSACKTFLQALPFMDTNSKIDTVQEGVDVIRNSVDQVTIVSGSNSQIIVERINRWGEHLAGLIKGDNKSQ